MAPVAWIFYFLIVFEIIYMIMPFFALSFYSFYGPSLNFLHKWPQTTWLTSFFLPHLADTSSWLLNSLNGLGRKIFMFSLLLFLIGAGQIYYAKFTKKGAVTGGLYKFIRHPQYTAFAIMGFGLTLVWPRFIILVMYVTMLFVYYLLAKKEEHECLEKFGDNYKNFLDNTSMFFPGDKYLKISLLPATGSKRTLSLAILFVITITISVLLAFGLRNYSINSISTLNTEHSATISLVTMTTNDMDKILSIAKKDPEVQKRLTSLENEGSLKLLNYITPLSWFVADLPLEPYEEGKEGHIQPAEFNKNEYKVLFTKAITHADVNDVDIVRKAYKRIPIIVVQVNLQLGKVIGINEPPPHVVWGDIPTPLF